MLDYEIYSECDQINDLIEKRDLATARCKVINLLDRMQQDGNQYNPMVNHFIRVVGLFPYIDKKTASWDDQVVVEAFKADVGDKTPVTLHSAQSRVLKRLLLGENIAVSAPTSFGKSFIIDAFISIRKPDNVVIIVPTIALADETRRRIEHKFSRFYKIITTTDATITETFLSFRKNAALLISISLKRLTCSSWMSSTRQVPCSMTPEVPLC